MHALGSTKPRSSLKRRMASYTRNFDLYLLLIPSIVFFVIFHYAPMYGVQIAFKNYSAMRGIWRSAWVGMKHFNRFFESYYFSRLIVNTLSISLYQLLVAFPIPIILAMMMNELRSLHFKKAMQTITYLPHFLSTVVVVSILNSLLSPRSGVINQLVKHLGGEATYYMGEPDWFRHIYVWSGIWQNMGWNSIIYVAALTSIDPTLYEAGRVDGASRLQMLWRITLPCILPTATIMLILDCGRVMTIGFDKVFLMQNDLNKVTSEVISTYVYQTGLIRAEYSFSTAVGLFNSVINCSMLVLVNWIAGRLGDTKIF